MKALLYRGEGGERRARYVTPDLDYHWEGAQEQCEDNTRDTRKKKRKINGRKTGCVVKGST